MLKSIVIKQSLLTNTKAKNVCALTKVVNRPQSTRVVGGKRLEMNVRLLVTKSLSMLKFDNGALSTALSRYVEC